MYRRNKGEEPEEAGSGDERRSFLRKAAVTALRRDVPDVPILLGGGGIRDQRHATRLGVDIYTGTGSTAAVEAVERLVG